MTDEIHRRIAGLSPEKRAKLEQRLIRGASNESPPRNAAAGPPQLESLDRRALSSAQTRLWFLDRLEPGGYAYNLPFAWRLSGTLDVAALETSLNEIVRRHEVLRTTFREDDGQPTQDVAASCALRLAVRDLSYLPETGREARARQMAVEEFRRPFDLGRWPLMRATLLRLGEVDQVLLLTVHHIVFDGWSIGILLRELSALYAAFSQGKTSPLPELAMQYADVALRQRDRLQGEVLQEHVTYWRQRLEGAPPVLALATDRPRPPVQTYAAGCEKFLIPKLVTDALRGLGQQEGVTLFMAMLAALNVLLYRYTDQEDLVVGAPIANRNGLESEGLIGFFVNMLALRTRVTGDLSYRDVLGRVREVTLGAYAHQDLPFEKLMEELQPERSLSHTPLFQVSLAWQSYPRKGLELPGLATKVFEVERSTVRNDLVWVMVEQEGALSGLLEYRADLFDPATSRRMVGHLQTLLAGIAREPDAPISRLPLLTEGERRQLLVEWNDTRREYPPDVCLHELVKAQVERTPEALAVVSEEERLTYRELDARASQLARYLRERGVAPGVLVGLCVERSVEMVVGILGVLKAGGAYVPLDPDLPKARLAFMLEDTGTPVLITQERLARNLPPHRALEIRLDADWARIAGLPNGELAGKVDASNLAYIMYTSGSTGRPKGVQIPHRGIVNRVRWMQDVGHLTVADRVLQKSSFSFDVSLWEVFWPLSIGACLVLARPGGEKDTTYLVEAIQREHITIVALAPSTLAVFLDEEGAPRCTSLRQVMCGGEALSHELQERFFARMRFAGLRNLYGPTEASVAVITWACRRDDPRRVVPIGMPAPNTQVYVLDGHLQLVPVGVAGELHIGGVQLAWGYLGRPQMTAERFIPNPFGAEPGARLYKTGDMVRYLPDGSIEFLGRQDHQVKLRGFRIELGEIESVLRQHPAVRDAIVLAREDVPGDTRLAAYVVFKVGQLPSVGELRGYLQERLPDYMVPAAYVTLRAFPVNSSGKVDRRALPRLEQDRFGHEAAFVRPRNGDEEALARIWADVLHLERIGVNDNFFDLGGHSLQAVQLISRSSAALGRKLSVRDIFVYPTIAKLLGALKDTPAVGRDAQAAACMQPPNLSRPAAQRSQPSLLRIEHRSLLPLFAVGKIPPVDSAVLGYLTRPRSGPDQAGGNWADEVPVCYRVMDTHLGRIAGILLPRFDSELYVDERGLVGVIVEALELAKHLGARAVSMAGLIPSATHYGEAVASAIARREDLPAVTTGHATTTASVIMAVARILRDSGRDLSQERLGVLGVGSIGAASLRLVLKCLPHPPEIVLCDLYSKAEALEQVAQQLRTELGYRGVLRTARWQRQVPADFYEASLIIGATNVPDVLDIAALEPGTLVVDDSGPHCFELQSAIRRLEERGDILFTEGGVLQSPQPISELRYVPPAAQAPGLSRLEGLLPRGTVHDPRHITGCVFSGLLSARFDSLKPTIGLMEVEACLRHYEKLHELGFQAAELHCKQYVLPEEAIRSFRQRFGAAGRAEG